MIIGDFVEFLRGYIEGLDIKYLVVSPEFSLSILLLRNPDEIYFPHSFKPCFLKQVNFIYLIINFPV